MDSEIWTEQRGTGVKLFYREKGKQKMLLAIGSYDGVQALIVKGSGEKLDGCCGAPTIYRNIELTDKGEKALKGVLNAL